MRYGHGSNTEVKWTRVALSNVEMYLEFANEFFGDSDLGSTRCPFHSTAYLGEYAHRRKKLEKEFFASGSKN
jgi:hypothetical protein